MRKFLAVVFSFLFVAVSISPLCAYAAESEISAVGITGVVEAALGNAPTTDTVTLPKGAGYKITEIYWQDNTAGTKEFSTFEDLHLYTLNIRLKAEKGYYFDNAPTVQINGKEIEGDHFPHYDNEVYIQLKYSFLKEIKKIDLPAFPTAVPLGESNKRYEPGDPPLIEKDEYSVREVWYTRYKSGDMIYQGEVDGEFVDGRLYLYGYEIGVKAGFEITENTEFTVGGKKVDGGIYNYFGYKTASIYNLYNNASLKEISKVEITFDKPVEENAVSKKFASETPGVQFTDFLIDDSANKKLTKRSCLGVMELTNKDASGSYNLNRYYAVKGVIEAVEGYYFAGDLKVTINGKEADLFPYLTNNMFEENSPTEFMAFMLALGKPEPKPIIVEPEPPSSEETNTEPEPVPLPEPVPEPEPEPKDNTVLVATLAAAGGAVVIGGGIFLIIFLRKKKKAE